MAYKMLHDLSIVFLPDLISYYLLSLLLLDVPHKWPLFCCSFSLKCFSLTLQITYLLTSFSPCSYITSWDFCFWSWWSNKDWTYTYKTNTLKKKKRTGPNPLQTSITPDKMHEITVLRLWTIDSPALGFLRKRGLKLQLPWFSVWGNFWNMGEKNLTDPCDLNELRKWRSNFGKAEVAGILWAEFWKGGS